MFLYYIKHQATAFYRIIKDTYHINGATNWIIWVLSAEWLMEAVVHKGIRPVSRSCLHEILASQAFFHHRSHGDKALLHLVVIHF